jgi:hypothetical protein
LNSSDRRVAHRVNSFFLTAFANFIESTPEGSQETFTHWLKARTEIWNQITFLRKASGSKLSVFVPVSDLSSLSKSGLEHRALVPGTKNDVAIAGGQILGDEYSAHVVSQRSGIILREGYVLVRAFPIVPSLTVDLHSP